MGKRITVTRNLLDAVFHKPRREPNGRKYKKLRGAPGHDFDKLYEAPRFESNNAKRLSHDRDAGRAARRPSYTPLVRWLRSHVGQPWNLVFGALSSAPFNSKEERKDVMQWAGWIIRPENDPFLYSDSFFINAEGLLSVTPRRKRPRYDSKGNKPLIMADGSRVVEVGGVYYATSDVLEEDRNSALAVCGLQGLAPDKNGVFHVLPGSGSKCEFQHNAKNNGGWRSPLPRLAGYDEVPQAAALDEGA